MIPMIIIVLFYVPAFLPFVSMVLAASAAIRMGKLGHAFGLEQYQALEQAYARLTDRLLSSSLFPSF